MISTKLDFNFGNLGSPTKLKANFVGNSVEKSGFYDQFGIKINFVWLKQRPEKYIKIVSRYPTVGDSLIICTLQPKQMKFLDSELEFR